MPLSWNGIKSRGKDLGRAFRQALDYFPGATLADLYDPLAMPPDLVKAHAALDRAVDAAYGKRSFASESERVAFLFERYRELTGALPAPSRLPLRKGPLLAAFRAADRNGASC